MRSVCIANTALGELHMIPAFRSSSRSFIILFNFLFTFRSSSFRDGNVEIKSVHLYFPMHIFVDIFLLPYFLPSFSIEGTVPSICFNFYSFPFQSLGGWLWSAP